MAIALDKNQPIMIERTIPQFAQMYQKYQIVLDNVENRILNLEDIQITIWVLSQLNCNNGNYGYSVEPEDHLFMCTRSEKYKYSYTLSKVENNCSFEVKHHVNVGGEVKLSIVGEWSGVMPISYTFNKDVNFNIY